MGNSDLGPSTNQSQDPPSVNRQHSDELILLHPDDNVLILTVSIPAGRSYQVGGQDFKSGAALGLGHKIARVDIPHGAKILKYGAPIGSATQPIASGEHVHLHNLKSDYLPTYTLDEEHKYEHSAH